MSPEKWDTRKNTQNAGPNILKIGKEEEQKEKEQTPSRNYNSLQDVPHEKHGGFIFSEILGRKGHFFGDHPFRHTKGVGEISLASMSHSAKRAKIFNFGGQQSDSSCSLITAKRKF